MNTQTIFQKELILLAFQRQNYYHRIKYIIFKSSSSKYNKVSQYYLCLIRELPVSRYTSLDQQSSSSQHNINTAGSTKSHLAVRLPRGEESVTSPGSMGAVSSPPNQATEYRLCGLTTSWSRRHGIQPTTAADQAQPTRPITAAFSHLNSFSQS